MHPLDHALHTKTFPKLRTAPRTLTETEREYVGLYGNERDRALLAKADAPDTPAEPARAPERVPRTITVATIKKSDDWSTPEGFDAWAVKHQRSVVPVALWSVFMKKNVDRRHALEAEVESLKQRVLELEADRAARTTVGSTEVPGVV